MPVWIYPAIFDPHMPTIESAPWFSVLKAAVFTLALIPLARLFCLGFSDGLGANPIEKITHVTGYWALTLLLISLGATPLRLLFGWHWPIRIRRMLGLLAFFYVCLHFASYLVLDQFFDWPAIADDIVKRPYITIGFAVFVMLLVLALTSSDAAIRRLGGKRWRSLHRLVYLCALGGVLHFVWLVKKDLSQPLIFAGTLALLLAIRLRQHYR